MLDVGMPGEETPNGYPDCDSCGRELNDLDLDTGVCQCGALLNYAPFAGGGV